MSTKAPELTWREGRRRAWELKQQGWKQQDIAAALALVLRRAKERLRHTRTVIQACFQQAGYHV